MTLEPLKSWTHEDRRVTLYCVKDYISVVAKIAVQQINEHVLPDPIVSFHSKKLWHLSEIAELTKLGERALCQTKSSARQFTNSRH